MAEKWNQRQVAIAFVVGVAVGLGSAALLPENKIVRFRGADCLVRVNRFSGETTLLTNTDRCRNVTGL